MRYALKGTSGRFDNTEYTLETSKDLSRVYHVDCDSESSNTNNNISCVIVGGDRKMIQYSFTPGGNTTINPLNKYVYQMYKDYEPMDIQIGSQYIIMKSESFDNKDKSVLVYKRQDVQDPGNGFLFGGVNGTIAGWDRWDWKNTKVQLAEYGGSHRIFLQHNEAKNAEIYEIGPLRISLNNANWHLQKENCILFDGSENSKCVPVQDIWYRNIPNQPGPPEKQPTFSNFDFWFKVLMWILAILVLLAVLLYLLSLFRASWKPGYSKVSGNNEKQYDYYEEREDYRDNNRRADMSTERRLVGRDEYISQEEVYGDIYTGNIVR